jgi:hypothetical protein
MSSPSLECGAVVERLIGGERASSDPQLHEHVSSCLGCFRTAADLRGLPQLREQLLRAQQQQNNEMRDPGEAFWASFPAKVSAAWEQRQREAAPEVAPAPTLKARFASWVTATMTWLQPRAPAALAGAVCAAIVVALVTRPGSVPEVRVATGPAESGPKSTDSDATLSMTAGGLVLGGAIDDSIKDLDVGALLALRSKLQKSLESEMEPTAEPGAPATVGKAIRGSSLADGQAESSGTALSDDLDELSETGLAVLAENLEGPI